EYRAGLIPLVPSATEGALAKEAPMFDLPPLSIGHGTWCTQWDYVADRFGAADLLPFTISEYRAGLIPLVPSATEGALAKEAPMFDLPPLSIG
ncbi:hypothetical protein CKQ90_31695, partial [Klebsiella pneumoniae]